MNTFRKLFEKQLKEGVLDPVKKDIDRDIWDKNNKLKPEHKKYIIEFFEKWLNKVSPKSKIKEVYYLGSTTGYQYNEESDIDIDIVVDNLPDEKIDEIWGDMPNGKNLSGTKHPINYYVLNKSPEFSNKGPVYDIMKEKWIVKSTKGDNKNIVENYQTIIDLSRFFIAGLRSSINEYEMDRNAYETYKKFTTDEKYKDKIEDKLIEVVNDIEGMEIAMHLIHSLRDEGFENPTYYQVTVKSTLKIMDGNSSINNFIYKYIEKLGILDEAKKIIKLKDDYSKLLGNKEEVKDVLEKK